MSRNAPHRWAMLRNMAASLIRHETIRTTLPKAKELRRVVEPLITLGKNDSDANRRRAFAQLRDAEVVVKLFEELGPRFKERPGGYTRILRMDPRPGDAAPMALMQLLDQPEQAETEGTEQDRKAAKKKTAKKRVSIKKKAAKAPSEEKAAKTEAKVEDSTEQAEGKAPKAAKKKAAAKKKTST